MATLFQAEKLERDVADAVSALNDAIRKAGDIGLNTAIAAYEVTDQRGTRHHITYTVGIKPSLLEVE